MRDKAEPHVIAEASEDTMCAVAYLRSQPNEYSADLAFVIRKSTDEASFNTTTGIASGSHGITVEGDSQET